MKIVLHAVISVLIVVQAFLEIQASEMTEILAQIESSETPQGPYSANIVCAEQTTGRILILDPNMSWDDPAAIKWEWHPSESAETKDFQTWFSNPSECKPVLGTSHLLMAASGGGVALVRLADKKVLFFARPDGNPHSAELLPDGNVVSISSAGFFTVFAVPETFTTPEVYNVKYSITGGHGIVWENASQRLWVLGYTELAAYQYNFNKEKPAMTKEFSIPLAGTPAEGGHDLYPVPGAEAFFTTGQAVAVFDISTRTFTTIREIRHIKSLSQSPEGALIALSPVKQWWSPSVTFFNQPQTPIGTLEGAKFYKARWWIPKSDTNPERPW